MLCLYYSLGNFFRVFFSQLSFRVLSPFTVYPFPSFHDFPHSFRPFVLLSAFIRVLPTFRVRFGSPILDGPLIAIPRRFWSPQTPLLWNSQSATRGNCSHLSETGPQNLFYAFRNCRFGRIAMFCGTLDNTKQNTATPARFLEILTCFWTSFWHFVEQNLWVFLLTSTKLMVCSPEPSTIRRAF